MGIFKKIAAKFLGDKIATVIFGDKVVTLQNKDDIIRVKAQIEQYKQEPTEELSNQIDRTLNKEKHQAADKIDNDVKQIQNEKTQFEEKVVEETDKLKKFAGSEQKKEQAREALKTSKSVDYDPDTKQYFLRGYESKIPMPIPLVEALGNLEVKGQDNTHLINFWKACMALEDPRARFDMFKYLVRQKLLITPHGFFVTFRRLVSLKNEVVKTNMAKQFDDLTTVLYEYAAKIKKWKQSPKNYTVVLVDGKHQVIATKNLKPENEDTKYRVIGMFKEMFDAMQSAQSEDPSTLTPETVQWYTDNHSKTFKIRIGHPVKMPREKCNSNPNQTCSYGLHVGTPEYVRKNSLGDTIVACLVNPMHVVSVPYQDAHKMRVCEYYPFKVITLQELNALDSTDLTKYEIDYLNFEWAELEAKLGTLSNEVYDDGTLMQGVETEPEKLKANIADIQKRIATMNDRIAEAKKQKNLVLSGDAFNSSLSDDEVRRIIESRIVKQ